MNKFDEITMKRICRRLDLTQLSPNMTAIDLSKLIDAGTKLGVETICIPPSFVPFATGLNNGLNKVCTVIGFPNGYSTVATKIYEGLEAIENGASEVDMVINRINIFNSDYRAVSKEVYEFSKAIHDKKPNAIVKIIVETAELDESQIRKLCQICYYCGANYIKTSTGFSPKGGASIEAVSIIMDEIQKQGFHSLLVKASGGIRTASAALKYIEMGCSRIGASNINWEE